MADNGNSENRIGNNSVPGTSIDENPLLKALPPATDYVNYLILLEYNLTKDLLPTLHSVLQDTKLTANIGWDLVPLLLPLLPESRQCIHDVARLGNPREVVIKVTEGLQAIAAEGNTTEEWNGEDDVQEHTADLHEASAAAKARSDPAVDVEEAPKDVKEELDEHQPSPGLRDGEVATEETEQKSKAPSQLLRYNVLIEALSLLHPRIKTKFPSRFLSTSLQAVLPAFSQVARDPATTETTLDLIKALSGPASRPKLPPRRSSSQVRIPGLSSAPASAPDPEGRDEVQGEDEVALQRRLVQSFLTWVVEGFVSSLPRYEDLPGLAWSSRCYEKMHPERVVPGKQTYTAMFADEDEELHMRDSLLGQCLALSRDLKLQPPELLAAITKKELDEEDVDELPANAADVPLSRTGSLYLYSALVASSALFNAPSAPSSLTLFPEFAAILQHSLGASTEGTLGSEPESAIDAVLFLGNFAWANSPDVEGVDDEVFHNTLQRLSLISANAPSPALRYQAHVLTSAILHLNPADYVRLAFIKDTLEHCPYENLKASAVGWLKDEILSAQGSPGSPIKAQHSEAGEENLFATPAVLALLAPHLLLNPSSIIKEGQHSSSPADAFQIFLHHQSFFLAVLNLLYLIISSPPIFAALQVGAFVKEHDVVGYGDRLRAASLLFQGRITSDAGEEAGRDGEVGLAELQLLDQTIERLMEALGKAGIS